MGRVKVKVMPLSSLVPKPWRALLQGAFEAESFAQLDAFLERERAERRVILPPQQHIFSALAHTDPEQVKVVIIGQDPYPTAGNANGLSFSVGPGMKIPGSLRNIFAALNADLGLEKPATGDLTAWAKRGVLLLNTVLTVREGEAGSHQGQGWEPFTGAVLEQINAMPGPIVFLCFGKHAQALAGTLIDASRHTVLIEPHPSPLNGRKFVESVKANKTFSKTNAVLVSAGREPIDWSL